MGTSHSSQIIQELSDENLTFVFRNAQGTRIVDGPPPLALLETIGILPTVDAVVLVEDAAASEFAKSSNSKLMLIEPGVA